MSGLPGIYFDGHTAAARPVMVTVFRGHLLVQPAAGGAAMRRTPLPDLDVSEPLAHAPLLFHFDDNATLEVNDSAPLIAALQAGGRRPGLIAQLQRRWAGCLAALVMLLAALLLGYTHGLPAVANWAAMAVPPELEREIGDQVLAALEGRGLTPTRVDEERRESIRKRLADAAAVSAPAVEYRLLFKYGRDGLMPGGFNAFALPGGTIVLLDGMVDHASDEQILGVLGHELGHLRERHSLRNLLQAVGLGLVAGLLWGDVSGVVTNAPVVVGALHYSREFEREADDFAARLLIQNGLGVQPLIELLQEVDRLYGVNQSSGLFDSHPGMRERIEYLRTQGGR